MENKTNFFKGNPTLRIVEIILCLGLIIFVILYLASLREKVEDPLSRRVTEQQIFVLPIDDEEIPEPSLEVPESILPQAAPVETKFMIQIASFPDQAKAKLLVDQLKAQGYVPSVEVKDLGAKGIWNRVYIGGLQTLEEAQKLLETLKQKYKDSFIRSL